jgi:hypothetical protein
MAINDEVFNSLDPLGPEYGKINAPIIDSKGLSPFEGDGIELPKINFPDQGEQFFPIRPNINNLESPQKNVRQSIVGVPQNKPGLNKSANYNDIKAAVKQNLKASIQAKQDKNTYAKIYSYDAGPDGNAFYKRYQAYGQEKFDEIGFSPIRDNESLFNAHTTWWDDHKRMMTNSFWPLFGRGFVAGPKSLGKMLTGDFFGTDLEDAAAYKEAAAIGQSSKKGVASFANNTIMNFGYSAGIMSEAILEEIGGVLLAPETLGGSFVVSTANLLKNTAKAFRGLDMAKDGYKAVNSTLDSINNVQSARKFWEQARNVGKMPLSPIGGTVRAYEAAKTADNLTNLGKAYKTAGGFYRDVVRMNMALSEARLEGGMVENQIYDNLYNQYYAKNDKAPGNALQYDMIKQSKKGALNTVLWNSALIYGSNAIVFPNIMGPKGGIRGYLKSSINEFQTIKGGKFGDFGNIMYNKAGKKIQFEKANFKNMILDYMRKPIHKAALGTLGYFKKNFTEGIQENLQEVISGANEKYYSDTFNSKALGSHEYSKAVSKYNTASQLDYYGKELGNQFTATGFETFASGFAMGTLASPLNFAFKELSIGYNRMFDKETYNTFKEQKLNITKNLIAQLNGIGIQEFLDSKTFNYAVQEGVANIKEQGSKKQANDADLEGIVSQMEYLFNSGTTDIFKEKMRHFSEMTPEEFEEAVPTVPKGEGAKYQAKIPDTLKKLDEVEQDYKNINERYPNPITDDNLPPKGSPEYADAVALSHGWKKAVQNAVYFKQSFKDTMARKAQIMAKYLSQAPLQGMTQRDSEVIFDYDKLRNEAAMLKDEVATLKELKDPESQRQYTIKQRKLEALTKLGEKTVKFSNFFNRYEKAAAIKAELQKQKGDVPVTDEEVEKVMDSVLGEYNDENKIKTFSEHEAAYKDYLRALGEVNGDYLFDQNVDESYELLADHYKLGYEANNLMQYVNLLHDPNAFMETADRNRKWMKELYNKRGEIYEKMIKEQLDLVIDNALLNKLANEGIYISLDDFAQWKKDATPPSEFFDNTRKMIIPEGTTAYDEYYAFFEQASSLKDQSTGTLKESLDQSLSVKLDEIDEQMAEAIDRVPKKEVKTVSTTLKSKNGVNITLAEIFNTLNQEEFAEGVFSEDAEPLVLYKDLEGNLRLGGKEGEIFKNLKATVDFTSVQIYTVSEQSDPQLVAPIEKRYEELKNKTREEYADRLEEITTEEEKPVEDFVPVTNDYESLLDYPALYNSLYKSFNEKILSKLSDQDQVNLTEEEEINLFNRFLKTDKEAKAEIDEFNKKKKLDVTTKETGEKGEFKFMYQGKEKSTEDYKTVVDLRKIQRRFIALINEIDNKENATTEDMTNKSKYKVLVTDFEKLIATRSRKGLTPELRAAIDKINTIKEKQGDIVITEEGITVNGEEYQTANNALGIEEVKSPFKDYVDEQVKNLFDPEGTPMFDETKITQEAYDNLFGDKGYLTKLKQRVDNGELFIVSQGLTVYDTKSKMASTIDLLVADANSNLTIVAVTPDSKSNWDIFNKKDNPKSKIKQAAMLQTANANLLMSMLGTEAKIAVLPIEMSVSTTDDKILSANKPTSPTLLATDFLIALNKTEAQAEIDKLIPVEKVTTTTDTKADIEKQKELENKVKELEEQRKALRSEDGSIPADKMSEFKRLGEEINKAKKAATRGYSDNSMLIKRFSEGADTSVTDPKILSAEDKKEAADIIEQVIQNSKTAEEALKKIQRLGYIFDISVTQNLKKYLDDRFDQNVPKIGNNKDSFQAWIYGKTDAELAALETNVVPADAESSDDVESPAVEAEVKEREVVVIDESVRYKISDFKADLDKVTTKEELNNLLADLSIKNSEQLISYEDLQEMATMVKEKANQLNTPQDIKIVPESLAPGTELVAKNTIFVSGVNVQVDETVVVKSVNASNKTIVVTPLNSTSSVTLTFNTLNQSFTLKDAVMNATEIEEEKVTPEDKIKIVESTDLVDTFVQNKTGRIDQIEETASNKSLEELDEELMDDLEC